MKDLKLRDKVRTLLYMIGMVAVLFMAETTIAYATSDDDALSNSILSEQPVDENRTNIREPGSSENADDLKQLNIANSLTVSYDGGNGELAGTLRILLILTAISLAPILLVTITSFTRILIVLHFTRQALNTTSAPPNQVLIAISLFLTFFIMQPTFSQIYTDAVVPFENGDIQLEEAMDLAIAPMREFMAGQTQVKDNLSIFIKAAAARHEALDHVLLFGPPGLGKTTLANIIANELNVNIRVTSGPAIERQGDLAAILTNLGDNDVLFIDEIHRLSKTVEEILYSAMEDFALDIIIGKGPAARSVRLDLPHFTLIGATTRLGAIAAPLRDRFGVQCCLEFYKPEELQFIITRAAEILNVKIDKEGAMEIARRSRGIANRLLKRVRDFAQVLGVEVIDRQLADEALAKLEVDRYGFDRNDRKILTTIVKTFGGGPVGIETIAAAVSEESSTIEDVIEPYLMQLGFLQRTPRGRCVTRKAYEHLGLSVPKSMDEVPEQLSL